jgi:hypothetical protein
MRVFNRHVSTRGVTLFAFETLLVSGSVVAIASFRGALDGDAAWRVLLVTVLFELCFYYNDMYDLTSVHAKCRSWRRPRAWGTGRSSSPSAFSS